MNSQIHIRKLPGTLVVRAGGAVLGESDAALELTEGTLPPVIYFPRDDLAMAFLDGSDRRSSCPRKGEAEYFTIALNSGELADAGWSYPAPLAEATRIAGHVAFDTVRVTVERV
ncbi:DUF427 domain-containing protein [Frigidibacter albus]|uniref:DUF427 domain-containing protein n=1 Tax=Frigidibacter albus TaxID=1465486 RepID=A0A6L8VIK1_9RHOB|nr:DUF427 domain-containing protein [Frigidibacter albus]MZQ88990.1 DUF427 domain-containing protein [Frigidibacter albus]NBE30953.1 DUF427 domain-containing protein [Frigidibacter albus]GGH52053.1 hypothetical protein GCM10011341_16190 [Frigidibacter albus]